VRRPSPALLIAVFALIVAVGGGTFAIAGSDKTTDKKIANKVVTKRAPGLSVAHATTAGTATTATTAGTANAVSSVKTFNISVGDTGAGGQDFLTAGPFTLKVICRINNAGNDSVEVDVRSSQDHSAMDGNSEQDDMVAGTDYIWTGSQSGTTGTQLFEASSSGTQSEGLYAADHSVIATGQTDEGVNLGGHTGQCQVYGFLQLF
jgi:hypothetical protein